MLVPLQVLAMFRVPAEELCAVLQEPFGAGSAQWVSPTLLHLLILYSLAVLQVFQALAMPCLLRPAVADPFAV